MGNLAVGTGKVHGMTVSANAMSCIIFAMDNNAGNVEMCNLLTGDQKKPEFLKKNPFHRIPTWEGPGGDCLGESGAILRHLALTYAPAFYRIDAKSSARIDFAIDSFSSNVYKKWGQRVYPVLGFIPDHPADQNAANQEFKEVLDNWTKGFLSEGKFCCGEKISIAEYKMLPYLYVLKHPVMMKQTGIKLSPRLEKYVNDILGQCRSKEILKSFGGYGFDEYIDTKKNQPDFAGKAPVIVGEGSSNTKVQTGPAKALENSCKIWGMPMSLNCMTCTMFVKDQGLGDAAMCDLMKGENKTSEFLSKNCFHQIPTLECSDGFTIGESSAILRYLAVNYKPAFYPTSRESAAKVDWAMDVVTFEIYSKLAYGVVYPIMGFAPAPADQKVANEELTDVLAKYEQTFLQNRRFVLGNDISIAEYKIVPYIFAVNQPVVAKKTGFKLPQRIEQYLQDISSVVNTQTLTSAGGFSVQEFLKSKE